MWNDNSFAFEETPCKFLKQRQYENGLLEGTVRGAASRVQRVEKCSLNFPIPLFVIRVNLLHP